MKTTVQLWTVARTESEAAGHAYRHVECFDSPQAAELGSAFDGHGDGYSIFPVTLTIEVGEPVAADAPAENG